MWVLAEEVSTCAAGYNNWWSVCVPCSLCKALLEIWLLRVVPIPVIWNKTRVGMSSENPTVKRPQMDLGMSLVIFYLHRSCRQTEEKKERLLEGCEGSRSPWSAKLSLELFTPYCGNLGYIMVQKGFVKLKIESCEENRVLTTI